MHMYTYGRFSFVGLRADKKECALWCHSTWGHSGHRVYIDDSYQRAPRLECNRVNHNSCHAAKVMVDIAA